LKNSLSILSFHIIKSSSVESFSFGGQAFRSDGASVVDGAHGHVALVARQLHLVVFHDVLFYDGISVDCTSAMFNSNGVDISAGQETIIARDMVGSLSGANGQIMELILLVAVRCV